MKKVGKNKATIKGAESVLAKIVNEAVGTNELLPKLRNTFPKVKIKTLTFAGQSPYRQRRTGGDQEAQSAGRPSVSWAVSVGWPQLERTRCDN